MHPPQHPQPDPVLPEGYVRPDGTPLDANELRSKPNGPRSQDRLLSAVYLGDVFTVRTLLEERDSGILGPVAEVQVNRLEPANHRNALMQCAFDPQSNITNEIDKNCTLIAELLVSAGTNIFHKDKHDWNAVAMGSIKGLTNFIRYLLSQGADINNIDSKGRTPLMKAVTHGHVNATRLLLTQGADIKIVDSFGWSVLHFCTRQLEGWPHHYVEIFKMLLLSEVNNSHASETQHKITDRQRKDLLVVVDAQDNDGRTALMYASLMNNNRGIEALLRAGADPTVEDNRGLTAYALSTTESVKIQLAHASAEWAVKQHDKWLKNQQTRNPHLNKEVCPKD